MTETKPKRRWFRFSVSSRRFLIGTALGLFLLLSATITHAEVSYTISDLGTLTKRTLSKPKEFHHHQQIISLAGFEAPFPGWL